MPELLYVVTHGLISLVRKKDGSFDALMISMEGHRFLAGTWLNERPIAEGEFDLTGVGDDATALPSDFPPGAPQLDRTRNVVLPVKQVPGLGPDVRTIIHLPKPIAVHSYFKGDISGSLTGNKTALAAVSKTLSGVQVLVYSMTDFDNAPPALTARASMEPHSWSPVPGRISDPPVAVLHLFNEPPADFVELASEEDQQDHNVKEFNKSTALLGANLTLTQQAVAESKDEEPIPGLLGLELRPLVFREDVVNTVAERLSQSGSPEPIGTDPATCNPAHGDEN
jgi:hypothetical protein